MWCGGGVETVIGYPRTRSWRVSSTGNSATPHRRVLRLARRAIRPHPVTTTSYPEQPRSRGGTSPVRMVLLGATSFPSRHPRPTRTPLLSVLVTPMRCPATVAGETRRDRGSLAADPVRRHPAYENRVVHDASRWFAAVYYGQVNPALKPYPSQPYTSKHPYHSTRTTPGRYRAGVRWGQRGGAPGNR